MSVRVLVVNEYNIADKLPQFRAGTVARHLLFGVQRLVPPQWQARIVGDMGGRTEPLRNRLKARWALLNLRALRYAWGADVVFSTFHYGAVGYGLLRRVVRSSPPLVMIVHGLPGFLRRPAVFRALYGAYDELLFLSPADHAAVASALPARVRTQWAPWGPSAAWLTQTPDVPVDHLLPPGHERFALAVGRSNRDWAALERAQAAAGFPLVVVTNAECPIRDGEAVRVHRSAPGRREAMSLAEVLSLYRRAHVLVLPLMSESNLNGLTALGEALATGHRVVMTATPTMGPFAPQYPEQIVPVPVGDATALQEAVVAALAAPQPVGGPSAPTAEAFEELLVAALRRASQRES